MGSTRLCITIFVVLWFGWKPRASKSFYSVLNNGTASDTDATNQPWSPACLACSRHSVDGDDRRAATSGVWRRKRRAPALSFPLPFLSSVREGNSTNVCIHAFSFLLSKHHQPQRQTLTTHKTDQHCRVYAFTLCGTTFVKTAVYKKEPEEDTVKIKWCLLRLFSAICYHSLFNRIKRNKSVR